MKNPLREVWAEGRTAFGLWAAIPSSFSAELVAGAGADCVCVDQQHGVVNYASMVPMLQAIGATGAAPITRVLSNDPFRIMKALDAGAWGVIVPLVNDAGEAARAVSRDRKSTRLNSSHANISYAVFCLKKKGKKVDRVHRPDVAACMVIDDSVRVHA